DAAARQHQSRLQRVSGLGVTLSQLRDVLRDDLRGRRAHVRDRRVDLPAPSACGGGASMNAVAAQYARHVDPAFIKLLGTLGYGRVFTRALGSRVWDDQGRAYLDLLA